MELDFKPTITSEVAESDEIITCSNTYDVTIVGNNKTVQKNYFGTKSEKLIIDDFTDVGNWKIVVKLNENIIFETEITI